jgi:UDP-glucose 4-epimerase
MNNTPSTILVTGGTGYIGSHTCVELLNSGHDVVIIDNLSNSKADVVERIENITGKRISFIKGDLLNDDDLKAAFSEATINCVIHFAGLKSVEESSQIPLKYYQQNVQGFINLLKHMERLNIRSLVFSSSATVYKAPQSVPSTNNLSTMLRILMARQNLPWRICSRKSARLIPAGRA